MNYPKPNILTPHESYTPQYLYVPGYINITIIKQFSLFQKTFVVGSRGCGKTEHIKRNILPYLKNHLVFDLNNEYDGFNRITNENNKTPNDFEKEIEQKIISDLNDTCFVLEDIMGYSPRLIKKISSLDKKIIMVVQSLKTITDYSFGKMYLFPTFDSPHVVYDFCLKNWHKVETLEKHGS